MCPHLTSTGFVGIAQVDAQGSGSGFRLDCWTLDGLATELYDAGVYVWVRA
jgi:hypothetical protein